MIHVNVADRVADRWPTVGRPWPTVPGPRAWDRTGANARVTHVRARGVFWRLVSLFGIVAVLD